MVDKRKSKMGVQGRMRTHSHELDWDLDRGRPRRAATQRVKYAEDEEEVDDDDELDEQRDNDDELGSDLEIDDGDGDDDHEDDDNGARRASRNRSKPNGQAKPNGNHKGKPKEILDEPDEKSKRGKGRPRKHVLRQEEEEEEEEEEDEMEIQVDDNLSEQSEDELSDDDITSDDFARTTRKSNGDKHSSKPRPSKRKRTTEDVDGGDDDDDDDENSDRKQEAQSDKEHLNGRKGAKRKDSLGTDEPKKAVKRASSKLDDDLVHSDDDIDLIMPKRKDLESVAQEKQSQQNKKKSSPFGHRIRNHDIDLDLVIAEPRRTRGQPPARLTLMRAGDEIPKERNVGRQGLPPKSQNRPAKLSPARKSRIAPVDDDDDDDEFQNSESGSSAGLRNRRQLHQRQPSPGADDGDSIRGELYDLKEDAAAFDQREFARQTRQTRQTKRETEEKRREDLENQLKPSYLRYQRREPAAGEPNARSRKKPHDAANLLKRTSNQLDFGASSSSSSDLDVDPAALYRPHEESFARARESICRAGDFLGLGDAKDLNCLDDARTHDPKGRMGISERPNKSSRFVPSPIEPLQLDFNISWDSIGGLDHHIQALKEMVFLPLLYPDLFANLKLTPPKGVLFYGPSGTGKTLCARALAASCGQTGTGADKKPNVSFFVRNGADCLSKWVGEAERNLRLMFEVARQNQPAIIFFDEIDGLAPVRSSRQDQIHSSIVSTLLGLMDGLESRGGIVVIGATNRLDAIDPALRRAGRFDRELAFTLPTIAARRKILEIHTTTWKYPPAKECLDEVAKRTVGYCGADLQMLCSEATLRALRRVYPQVYNQDKKLKLDPEQVRVGIKDFLKAFGDIVPNSVRANRIQTEPLPSELGLFMNKHLKRAYEILKADFLNALNYGDLGEAFRIPGYAQQSRSFSPRATQRQIPTDRIRSTGHVAEPYGLVSEDTVNSESLGELGDSEEELELPEASVEPSQASPDESVSSSTESDDEEKIGGQGIPDVSEYHKLELHEMRLELALRSMALKPFRPHLLICGPERSCQTILASHILHAMEGFPLHQLDLASLMAHPNARTLEEAVGLVLKEARRVVPSVLFIPHIDSWWSVASEALKSCLLMSLKELPPSLPLLIVATADSSLDAMEDTDGIGQPIGEILKCLPRRVELQIPSDDEISAFIQSLYRMVSYVSYRYEPNFAELGRRQKAKRRSCLETVEFEPEPQPERNDDFLSNNAEKSKHSPEELGLRRREDIRLRELRMEIREFLTKILNDRRFKIFTTAVDPSEAPDYYDIITCPVDLSMIAQANDNGKYTTLIQMIQNIDLLVKNAIHYNSAHTAMGASILRRAHALMDIVHAWADSISPSLIQDCNKIYARRIQVEDELKKQSAAISNSNAVEESKPVGSGAPHPPVVVEMTPEKNRLDVDMAYADMVRPSKEREADLVTSFNKNADINKAESPVTPAPVVAAAFQTESSMGVDCGNTDNALTTKGMHVILQSRSYCVVPLRLPKMVPKGKYPMRTMEEGNGRNVCNVCEPDFDQMDAMQQASFLRESYQEWKQSWKIPDPSQIQVSLEQVIDICKGKPLEDVYSIHSKIHNVLYQLRANTNRAFVLAEIERGVQEIGNLR